MDFSADYSTLSLPSFLSPHRLLFHLISHYGLPQKLKAFFPLKDGEELEFLDFLLLFHARQNIIIQFFSRMHFYCAV